jgi:hypothetical protein
MGEDNKRPLPRAINVWYTREETRLLFTLKAMEGKLRYIAMPWPYTDRVIAKAGMDYAFACWEYAKSRGGPPKSKVRPRTGQLIQDGGCTESLRLHWWLQYRELGAASNNNDVIHGLACLGVNDFIREWCRVRAIRDASKQLSGYRYFRFWMWCDKHGLNLKRVKEV